MRGALGPTRISTRAPLAGPATLLLFVLQGCATAPSPAPAPPPTPAEVAARFAAELDPVALGLSTEVPTWTLAQWQQAARRLNPDLQVARARIEAARAGEARAAQADNPRLDLSLERVLDTGSLAWLYGVALDVLLRPRSQFDRRRALAASQRLVAHARWSDLAARLDDEIERAWHDHHHALRLATLLDRQRALREQAEAMLRQRIAAGAADAATLPDAAQRLAETRSARIDADRLRDQAHARLAGALGLPSSQVPAPQHPQATAPDAMPAAADDAARQLALVRHPQVLQALQAWVQADLVLAEARDPHRAGWRLSPGYEWDRGDRVVTLGAGGELPLLHANEGGIAEALAQRQAANLALAAVQAEVHAGIARAQLDLESATTGLEQARAARELARAQQAAVTQRLGLGAASRAELLASQDLQLQAEIGELRAQLETARAAAALRLALRVADEPPPPVPAPEPEPEPAS